jgi:hypothetical protein
VAAADFKVPPAPNHHVTDTAGVLNDGTRDWVENDLQSYEAATGHQVIVWIGQTTGGVPLETWTGETAGKWKIGRRGHDDGAVLFVFMRDRIVTGTILPRMRHGDVNSAISSGVVAMVATITPTFTYTESVLWNFGSVSGDGAYPYGGVLVNKKGAITGTTVEGGSGGSSGPGTIFTLTPSGSTYKEAVYSFTGTNGANPYAGPSVDKKGNLYVTTSVGGKKNDGAVVVLHYDGWSNGSSSCC